MKNKSSILFSILLLTALSGTEKIWSQTGNWTFFRGSNLNGIAVAEKIPLIWNDSTTKWKTGIHDRGCSSPVVFGNQIWLTTAKPDGKEVYAVAVDFNTGKIIYDISVFTPV